MDSADVTTNRTPINRPALTTVTPRALDLYESMGKLKCSCPSPKPPTQGPCAACAAWYDLHADLHDELQCEPWQWPCVGRQSPKRAGSTCWNEDIAARTQLLKEAARARRTTPSSLPSSVAKSPQSSASEEGDPNANVDAGGDTLA
jgi:hypothetical protein